MTTPTSMAQAVSLASAAAQQIHDSLTYAEVNAPAPVAGALKALHPGLNTTALAFESAMGVPTGTFGGVANPADGDPKRST